jgi:hypothetical protein
MGVAIKRTGKIPKGEKPMNGLQKVYIRLWIVYATVILTLFFTTGLTMLVLTILGFVTFGLIFMGMMCVLPSTVAHPGPAARPMHQPRLNSLRRYLSEWIDPIGIEMDKPRSTTQRTNGGTVGMSARNHASSVR